MRTLILSTFLYALESWTLKAEIERRIQALEMRCYRRLLNISYKDHVTNEEVRNRIQNATGVHEREPQITLWSYKRSFIQPFTPTIARNTTLEAMSLHVHYYDTNKISHIAALLYVNHNIQIVLGAICKWFHITAFHVAI